MGLSWALTVKVTKKSNRQYDDLMGLNSVLVHTKLGKISGSCHSIRKDDFISVFSAIYEDFSLCVTQRGR